MSGSGNPLGDHGVARRPARRAPIKIGVNRLRSDRPEGLHEEDWPAADLDSCRHYRRPRRCRHRGPRPANLVRLLRPHATEVSHRYDLRRQLPLLPRDVPSDRRESRGWSTDYPGADINLSVRLAELTKVRVTLTRDGEEEVPDAVVVRLTDDALFQLSVHLHGRRRDGAFHRRGQVGRPRLPAQGRLPVRVGLPRHLVPKSNSTRRSDACCRGTSIPSSISRPPTTIRSGA